MPTKEEKHQSSGGSGSSSNSGGGGGNSSSNGTNTNNSSSSSSSGGTEKHKYCLLCNRNDFTLNTFDPTIEKDLRAIFNTEIKFKENRKVCLQCLFSIKLLKRSTRDGQMKKCGDCCKDLFDNMTYFQELRNKYQRYVNRVIDNRKDSSKKASDSSYHSPISTNTPASSTPSTSPDVINTITSTPPTNSSNSNSNSGSKHATKLNDKSTKSNATNGKSLKLVDISESKSTERTQNASAITTTPNTSASTNNITKTKDKERERERDRDKEKDKDKEKEKEREKEKEKDKDKEKDMTKSSCTASSSTIKNKAQLKQLPKTVNDAVITVDEIEKHKSPTKPENCVKEKLINGTAKSDDGASKSNNRRSCDRKVVGREPPNCNSTASVSDEKTKSTHNSNSIVENKMPSRTSPVAEKTITSVETTTRAKLAKLPTNTKKSRIQRSSSPKRHMVATPTRQQRTCSFGQALCQPEIISKDKAEKRSILTQTSQTTKVSTTNTTDKRTTKKSEIVQKPTSKVLEKKLSESTIVCPPIEKFEYTIINGLKIEVPERVKLDKKMFNSVVLLGENLNSKRKANGVLDITPPPSKKKRKSRKHEKNEVKSRPSQSDESNVKLVPCNNHTPRSILQKSDRPRTPLNSKKRVSFTGVPSPPKSPEKDIIDLVESTEILENEVTNSTDKIETTAEVQLAIEILEPVETPEPTEMPKPIEASTQTEVTKSIETQKPKEVKKCVSVSEKIAEISKVVETPKALETAKNTEETPIDKRLRPKKSARTANNSLIESSNDSKSQTEENDPVASEIVDDLLVEAVYDTVASEVVCETVIEREIVPIIAASAPVAAVAVEKPIDKMPVTVEANESESLTSPNNETAAIPIETEVVNIIVGTVNPKIEEIQSISDADNCLEQTEQIDEDEEIDEQPEKTDKREKSVKKKRKSYTKRTKVSSPPVITTETVVNKPAKKRGRPFKIRKIEEDVIEANRVEIVNLEEIKRNNVLENIVEHFHPPVHRTATISTAVDDKDEDDVRMIMEDDPLAVETECICTSPMLSSPTRMPLPMPILIHRTPAMTTSTKSTSVQTPASTTLKSPIKQQIATPIQAPMQSTVQSPIQVPAPTYTDASTQQPESSASPHKSMTLSPTEKNHENIRLKISNGKVTTISPTQLSPASNSNDENEPSSQKPIPRSRIKRIRKKKMRQDFVANDSLSESDDPYTDRKKHRNALYAKRFEEFVGSLGSTSSRNVDNVEDSVDQGSKQMQQIPSTTTITPPPPSVTSVSTVVTPSATGTTAQIFHTTPVQYDERVFRAYVLVDKIPQSDQHSNSELEENQMMAQPVSVSIPVPTSVSLSVSQASAEMVNSIQHMPRIDDNLTMDANQTIENYIRNVHRIENLDCIDSEANCMNVIENYTTLAANDGLTDGMYELQDAAICENVESPNVPISTDNAGAIIGFESPATVDSTTSGYSSATATSSVYLLDTQALNHSIEVSNGFNTDFNMQLETFPFVEIQTSDIIDILGKTNDCSESLNMENISLDSTATTADTRTFYLTDEQASCLNTINTINTLNTVATVTQALPTLTTGNILGVFRTKASLKQIDPPPMHLQLNDGHTAHVITHQQTNAHASGHVLQQHASNNGVNGGSGGQMNHVNHMNNVNVHGHGHGASIPNDISAKMLRTDNPILNAVISSNEESAIEMQDASESFSMTVDSMVTSSDTVAAAQRRPGLNVVFSTPSKRNNVYLSNENVSLDEFISESHQSLLNPDNFPTTTTTEEPHLDFYTLGI